MCCAAVGETSTGAQYHSRQMSTTYHSLSLSLCLQQQHVWEHSVPSCYQSNGGPHHNLYYISQSQYFLILAIVLSEEQFHSASSKSAIGTFCADEELFFFPSLVMWFLPWCVYSDLIIKNWIFKIGYCACIFNSQFTLH